MTEVTFVARTRTALEQVISCFGNGVAECKTFDRVYRVKQIAADALLCVGEGHVLYSNAYTSSLSHTPRRNERSTCPES